MNILSLTLRMLYGHVHSTLEYQHLRNIRKQIKESWKEDGNPRGNFINVGCMMDNNINKPQILFRIVMPGGFTNENTTVIYRNIPIKPFFGRIADPTIKPFFSLFFRKGNCSTPGMVVTHGFQIRQKQLTKPQIIDLWLAKPYPVVIWQMNHSLFISSN